MIKRSYKLIISVVLVTTLFLLGSVIAFADPLAGAIAGSMGAMGATIGSTGATVGAYDQFISGNGTDPLGNLDPLGDHYVYYQKNSRTDPATGISYDTIWFSHDFSRYLQDEGIAFLDDHTVLPNTSGVLASGAGYITGIPIYTFSGNVGRSSIYTVHDGTTVLGDVSFTVEDNSSTATSLKKLLSALSPYGSISPTARSLYLGEGTAVQFQVSNVVTSQVGAAILALYKGSPSTLSANNGITVANLPFTNQSFSFDYVSGTIDTDPIDSDLGLKIEIPSTYIPSSVPSGTYRVDGGSGDDTIYRINAGVNEAAKDNNSEGEYTLPPVPVPPTPPPTPVPTNLPLGEVPYPDFLDTFGQSVYDKLDGIRDKIDTVGRSIEGIIEDAKDSIDTIGQSITGILTDIKNAILTIPQTLAQILEAVITHPLDMFSAYLDAFLQHSGIGGLLDDLKDHLGIWHYVVEWLQCIGAAFAFFFGIMSSTAYCMVVPIYALVAGSICLAIYKRFGR